MTEILTTRDRIVQSLASKEKFVAYQNTMRVAPERLLSHVLPDGSWRGQRCFVIGGGASLRSFDFSRLVGERIIAVNRAYEYVPFADMMCSMDTRYLRWIRQRHMRRMKDGQQCLQKFIEFQGLKVWIWTRPFALGGIYVVKGIGDRGVSFSLNKGVYHGNNSGHGAINIAICLGASPIYLLGFDMKHEKSNLTHFHDGYPVPQRPYFLNKCIVHLESLAERLKDTDVKIINLNPDSALQCFPKRSIDNVLKKRPKIRKRPFMIISYFTKNTGYQNEIQKLIRSARALDLPIDVEGVENLRSWQLNTHYKAKIIRKMLDKHPDKSIVFVDADALIRRDPMLFRTIDADLGICFRDYRRFPSGGRKEGKEFLSGTIYFSNNKKTRDLVDRWIRVNDARPTIWEQKNLFHVIKSFDGDLKIFEFPPTYCQIFDSMRNAGNPIIEQMQASRKLRSRV